MDGQNATVSMMAVPFGKDINSLQTEMNDYIKKQMNNVSSNATTIKEGLSDIAAKYGFKKIDVNIHSQFGDDKVPMKVKVDGLSMYPTLKNGEMVIIEKTNNPKVGDIIVAKDPQHGLLIKRLGNVSGSQIFLSSDNNGTINTTVNGVPVEMVAVEKWTNASNIVGVAKEFNV